METGNSGPKVSLLYSKSTDEGRDPYRLVILELRMLFWMHKSTDEAGTNRYH